MCFLTRLWLADNVAPTFNVTIAAGQANPTNGALNFVITPSKSVPALPKSAISLAVIGGSVSLAQAQLTLIPSGAAYQLLISGLAGSGQVAMAIAAGVVTDPAGNSNPAAPAAGNPAIDFGSFGRCVLLRLTRALNRR